MPAASATGAADGLRSDRCIWRPAGMPRLLGRQSGGVAALNLRLGENFICVSSALGGRPSQ